MFIKQRTLFLLLVILCAFAVVSCSKSSSGGIPTVPPVPTDPKIKDIVGGLDHNLMLMDDGSVYVVGSNSYGQLGISGLKKGEIKSKYTLIPQSAFGDKKVAAIGSCDFSSFALTEDGSLYSWGRNGNAQLGLNDIDNRETPEKVIFGTDTHIVKIAFGVALSLALDNESNLYAWGYNVSDGTVGVLGTGSTAEIVLKPEAVDLSNLGSDKIKDIKASNRFALILSDKGEVYSWGENQIGVLGRVISDNVVLKPEKIDKSKFGNEKVDNISIGFFSVIAVTESGKIYGWGNNSELQLGIDISDPNNTSVYEPTLISGGIFDNNQIKQINASYGASFALTKSDEVYSWGAEYGIGILGQGKKTGKYANKTPVKISGDIDGKIVNLYISSYNVFIYTDKNKLYAWGYNGSTQQGDGLFFDKFVPTLIDLDNHAQFAQMSGVKEISGGGGHSVALDDAGDVFVWGGGLGSLLGIEDFQAASMLIPFKIPKSSFDNKTVVSVVAGRSSSSSYALTSDGSVYAWGGNKSGSLCLGDHNGRKEPAEIDFNSAKIVKIAAGVSHFMALDDAGKLYACGINGGNFQYLGTDSTEDRVVLPKEVILTNLGNEKIKDIKAGNNYSLILTKAGDIYTWGDAESRMLGLGGGLGTSVKKPTKIDRSKFGSGAVTKVDLYASSTVVFTGEDAASKIYVWGVNSVNQLSSASSNEYELSPVELSGGIFDAGNTADIYFGSFSAFALTKSGELYSWGSEGVFSFDDKVFPTGSLGQGEKEINYKSPTPVKISGDMDGKVVKVFTGRSFSFALTESGKLYTWGENNYGQLGLGYTESIFVPTLR